MLDLSLALRLKDAGLAWRPRPGDRFAVTRTEMLDDTFYLADMVIEARHLETGTIFAFNGTTEWALDSVAQEHTVWIPSEGQLREALGARFAGLNRDADGFVVTLTDGARFHDPDVENAYGSAVLAVLGAPSQEAGQ